MRRLDTGRLWEPTLGNERGSALLIGLFVIAIMSLLGVALFEMGTIEAGLVTRGDVQDIQAFYCAESALAYIMSDATKTTVIGALAPGDPPLSYPYPDRRTVYGSYTVNVVATVIATVPTITATCALPWGTDPAKYPSRTVRMGIQSPSPIYEFGVVSGDNSSRTAGFGNFYLGGTGKPTNTGGNYVGGADTVNGDIYVSGTAALRGAPLLTPCHSIDCDPTNKNPQLTAIGGLVNTSTTFDPTAPGAFGTTGLNPMPDVFSTIASIRAAVGSKMTGTYNGSTVYNLTQIFAPPPGGLGTTNEGNNERNLAKPSGCTFGSPTEDLKCQIWQDLIYVGIKRTSANPGPSDAPGYYFMGIPTGGVAPQGTSPLTVYNALVNASPELRQMGFTAGNLGNGPGSLAVRLDTLAGQDTGSCGSGCADNVLLGEQKSVDRLVDLTMGTNANGQAVLRSKAPIFFIDDGYFRVDDGTNFAYNGIGTVVVGNGSNGKGGSVIISDNIIYLNGNSNKNPPGNLPSVPDGCNDRTNCGLADVLGLVAQNDIWVGDAGGSGQTVEWVSGVMLAGRDFNYFNYASSSACCQGPANPVTLNGTAMASRQVTMARDWSDPQPRHDDFPCNGAGAGGCRPVQFFPKDPTLPPDPPDLSCASGCWRYLTIDGDPNSRNYGTLIVDKNFRSFQGCETTEPCKEGRRITHFQLNARYEHRLYKNADLIPPGLPTGGGNLPPRIVAGTWKDCGGQPACP